MEAIDNGALIDGEEAWYEEEYKYGIRFLDKDKKEFYHEIFFTGDYNEVEFPFAVDKGEGVDPIIAPDSAKYANGFILRVLSMSGLDGEDIEIREIVDEYTQRIKR